MAGTKVKVVIYSQTQSPSALSVGDLEGLFKDLLHCCALCSILDSSSNACASKVTKANELSCSIQPLNTLHITSKDTKISPGGVNEFSSPITFTVTRCRETPWITLLLVSELVTEGRHKADLRDKNKGNCDVRAFLLCLLLIQFLFVFPLLLLVSRLESLETFIDQLKFEHTTLSSRWPASSLEKRFWDQLHSWLQKVLHKSRIMHIIKAEIHD